MSRPLPKAGRLRAGYYRHERNAPDLIISGGAGIARADMRLLGCFFDQPIATINAYGERVEVCIFDEKNLPKQVLYPLRDAGLITVEKTTEGRGAKPFMVAVTERFQAEILEPLLEQFEAEVDEDLRKLRRKPLDEVLQELGSDDRYVAGLALEALAFKLMMKLDIRFVKARLRGPATGGAECDLIFEADRLIFSRWQVQCKNVQGGVTLNDVAKEVGLHHVLRSNVIVVVSTGAISTDARAFAKRIMRDTHLNIVLIDGNDVIRVQQNPFSIIDIFGREAKEAMKAKPIEM